MDLGPYGYYAVTIIVYFFIYNILTWGLNIQFGYAGIPNFTYITFVAAGAYFSGALGLHPPGPFSQAHYILGLGWPFPATMLGGAVVAALLGAAVGLVTLTRLRSDYLAIVTFSLGFIAFDFVNSFVPLFNGIDGLSGVPLPLNDTLQLDYNTYTIFYIGLSGVIMLVLWFVAHRIYNSSLGRTLRAIREDLDVAEALGKDTFRFRMIALVIGCFYAGVGGALLLGFITAINPSSIAAPETFVIWAALLVGGRGNNLGAVIGALVVPVLIVEGTRFIPVLADQAALVAGLRNVVIGLLLILILWFRPDGLLPERKRRFFEIPVGGTATNPVSSPVTK